MPKFKVYNCNVYVTFNFLMCMFLDIPYWHVTKIIHQVSLSFLIQSCITYFTHLVIVTFSY